MCYRFRKYKISKLVFFWGLLESYWRVMLQQLPIGAFVPWTPSNGGCSLGPVEIKMSDTPVPRSIFHGQKFQVGLVYSNAIPRLKPEIFCCGYKRPNHRRGTKKHEIIPQNEDLPPILPKKKKKPYPIPIKKILEAARADRKLAQMGIEKPLEPPRNGILVPDLIPVAHEVVDAWKVLIRGLAQLLHVVLVHACSECSEIHIAQIGHEIQDCHGPTSGSRRSFHSWIKGPFGRRIRHETRFNYDRIPAVVKLCIQAGVELPEYPSRRRSGAIRMLGKKVIDIGGYVEEPRVFQPGSPGLRIVELDTYRAMER